MVFHKVIVIPTTLYNVKVKPALTIQMLLFIYLHVLSPTYLYEILRTTLLFICRFFCLPVTMQILIETTITPVYTRTCLRSPDRLKIISCLSQTTLLSAFEDTVLHALS